MNRYRETGALDLDTIGAIFGYYIKITNENDEITKFIKEERKKPGMKYLYSGYSQLVKEHEDWIKK